MGTSLAKIRDMPIPELFAHIATRFPGLLAVYTMQDFGAGVVRAGNRRCDAAINGSGIAWTRCFCGAALGFPADGASYLSPGGPLWSGDMTFAVIAMRAADTGTANDKVEEVIAGKNSPTNTGIEFNLGNGFGAAPDINKPRLADLGGTATGLSMWINGAAQAAVNPAPLALNNGQFYSFVGSGKGFSSTSANQIGSSYDGTTRYGLNGQIAFLAIWNRVLPPAACQKISADPIGELYPESWPSLELPDWIVAAAGATVLSIAKTAFGFSGQSFVTNAREMLAVAKAGFSLAGQAVIANAREVLAIARMSFSVTGQAVAAVVASAQTVLIAAARFVMNGAALSVLGAGGDTFTWLPGLRTRDRTRVPTTVPKE